MELLSCSTRRGNKKPSPPPSRCGGVRHTAAPRSYHPFGGICRKTRMNENGREWLGNGSPVGQERFPELLHIKEGCGRWWRRPGSSRSCAPSSRGVVVVRNFHRDRFRPLREPNFVQPWTAGISDSLFLKLKMTLEKFVFENENDQVLDVATCRSENSFFPTTF